MEENEMEMSKEDLQKWVREKVKESGLISPDVLEKCKLLQSLLERREKQAAQLLQLYQSVAACEAIVRKQYSLLGWEYTDTDSDDGDKSSSCGHTSITPSSPCESVHSESTEVHRSPATNAGNGIINSICLLRKPVVVLNRFPASKIRALLPPAPPHHYSEHTSSSNSDSDMEWEPQNDSSDSDISISGFGPGSKKKRKLDQVSEGELDKSRATPQADTDTDAESDAAKTSPPKANRNTNGKSNAAKTSTLSANPNVSAFCQSSDEAAKPPPGAPQGEVRVKMNVLARRRDMRWKRGKIMEIIKKDNGRLKYKVNFEDKGKSLVSGHHIAFDCMPKVEQLFVGARVVVKCQADHSRFCPGIIAELPGRKNRMRFLVFIDDHTPAYVALPFLHLVCRPLTDPLDDIPNDTHRNFMKQYLKIWPYPPQTKFKVGQLINAEFKGVQQKCEVQVVDCSLIRVVFEEDQHKEWIYRGSVRLEH